MLLLLFRACFVFVSLTTMRRKANAKSIASYYFCFLLLLVQRCQCSSAKAACNTHFAIIFRCMKLLSRALQCIIACKLAALLPHCKYGILVFLCELHLLRGVVHCGQRTLLENSVHVMHAFCALFSVASV